MQLLTLLIDKVMALIRASGVPLEDAHYGGCGGTLLKGSFLRRVDDASKWQDQVWLIRFVDVIFVLHILAPTHPQSCHSERIITQWTAVNLYHSKTIKYLSSVHDPSFITHLVRVHILFLTDRSGQYLRLLGGAVPGSLETRSSRASCASTMEQ